MKLMTQEVIKNLPGLYSQENKKSEDVKIAVKFFTPWSKWTWFISEGEKQDDGDWLFFGMVHGMEKELGYFSLSELESIKGPFGLKIERDMYYGNHKMSEVME